MDFQKKNAADATKKVHINENNRDFFSHSEFVHKVADLISTDLISTLFQIEPFSRISDSYSLQKYSGKGPNIQKN